ncbi:hypothetical protein L1987_16304 [Smallanthus sonchifolius]|uniref:Uncharacterized protein n=1 Tax=Smallanthus sonchifolius TaxID=185202 RepID=A0ACB9JA61_9ASTR|nr:hypothetical protein L1987_16304 [Smallanthus sonchifolius]
MKWNQNAAEGYDKEEQKSHMIVETDVCLPLLASEESHISSNVLINYELLTKKVLIEWNLGIIDQIVAVKQLDRNGL